MGESGRGRRAGYGEDKEVVKRIEVPYSYIGKGSIKKPITYCLREERLEESQGI
jgi:hypothetical protein